ncbi:hypothetical protein AMTRI_Chr12g240240 [Amborella trichopoda]
MSFSVSLSIFLSSLFFCCFRGQRIHIQCPSLFLFLSLSLRLK